MKNIILLFVILIQSLLLAQTTPIITQQPQDQTVTFGNSARFTVKATTDGNLGYQWWRVPYTGPESKIEDKVGYISGSQTNELFILTSLEELDGTQYLCEVKNFDGYPESGYWLNSSSARLTVNNRSDNFIKIMNPYQSLCFDNNYSSEELTFDYEYEVESNLNIEWITNIDGTIRIEYSTDAGKTWTLIADYINASLKMYNWIIPNTPSPFCKIKLTSNTTGINAVSPQDVIMVDGYDITFAIVTENAWTCLDKITNYNLKEVKFNSINSGYIYGNSCLLVTNDGGINWAIKSDFKNLQLDNVVFINENVGWGRKYYKYLYKTVNGGDTWLQISNNLSFSQDAIDDGWDPFRKIQMVNDLIGWYIYNESMYKTYDGGYSWILFGTAWDEIFDFKFINDKVGWFKIIYGDGNTSYQFTNNGNFAWVQDEPTNNWITVNYMGKMEYLDSTNIWITRQDNWGGYGGSRIFEFTNDKQNFIKQYEVGIRNEAIYAFNSNLLWLKGETYKLNSKNNIPFRHICISRDGGNYWELQTINYSDDINQIYSYNGKTIWAVGSNGMILKYENEFDSTPIISQQPLDQTVDFGNTATFSVSAVSSGTLGFQWWRVPYVSEAESKIVDIPGKIEGATTNSLKILNATMDDNNTQYLCEVKNLDGYPENGYWINTDAASLTVIPSTSKSVRITYPPNEIGFEFEVGSLLKIEWISNNIENITIEYTTDAGKTWNTIIENYPAQVGYYNWTVPNTPTVFCNFRISSSSENDIYSILPTSWSFNDFESWFTIYGENKWIVDNSISNQNIKKITFSNKYTGIAYNDDKIFITKDGGENWDIQNTYDNYNLTQVHFLNEKIGFGIYETNSLMKTTNGGKIWFELYRHNTSISKFLFIDEQYGWICNPFYKTIDSGLNWSIIKDGSWADDFEFLDKEFGYYIRTDYSDYQDGIEYTYNGGDDWEFTIESIDTWLVSEGTLFHSDKNNSWQTGQYYDEYLYKLGYIKHTKNRSNFVTQYRGILGIQHIYFINNNVGWLWGYEMKEPPQDSNYPRSDKFCISMSLDSGNTWQLQSINQGRINSIYSYDSETAWAIGDSGLVLRYGDFNSSPENWTRNIVVEDNLLNSIEVSFGQSFNATNTIDNNIGEEELPPFPPQGTFDARFILEDNSSTILDLRNSEETEIAWTIQFQPSSNGYPIKLSWDKENLPFGSFFLRDAITGSIINVDMKLVDSLVVTNESINKLKIVYKEQFTSTITNYPNWDLLSVPLASDNMSVTSIFPDATSSAFKFDGSYKSTDNLENGVGYWLKFNDSSKTNIYGDEINEPIPVKKGWNIIGPYNKEVSIDQITSNPDNIKASSIYGFTNHYFLADKLKIGRGYWIKVNQDGEITFTDTSPLGKKPIFKKPDTEPSISFDIIAFDGVNDSIKLTFGLDSLATNGYDPLLGEEELPPLPPLGVFDVRLEIPDTLITSYSDYRPLAVDCYEHKISYQLGDSSLGLTLRWNLPEGVTLNLSDMFGGTIFNIYADAGEGSYTIGNTEINNAKLTLCYSNLIVAQHDKDLIPDNYNLSQNYPNPFNPTTHIQFGLPRESKVSLVIYNILGQKVAELVNQQLKAGYHEVEFNSSKYSSGIYFYRIQAGDFVETKKMILIK